MKTADNRPFVYEKHQLIETICQLRFPTILSIETKEPADFQDTIRAAFPGYSVQMDPVPGPDGKPAQVKNHSFISEDGTFKLSLTKDFIALSTMRYPGWEEFARTLDEPLGQFIRVYHPAFFQRVGLRFVNGISREKLDLTGRRWNDLLQPQVLGILDKAVRREQLGWLSTISLQVADPNAAQSIGLDFDGDRPGFRLVGEEMLENRHIQVQLFQDGILHQLPRAVRLKLETNAKVFHTIAVWQAEADFDELGVDERLVVGIKLVE